MDLLLAFAHDVGSVICHQLPDRSFFVNGWQLPVCARCTGLYLSGAAGLLGWLMVKSAARWRAIALPPRTAIGSVIGAGVPTAISYLCGVSGVWDGSNLTRAVLAVPLGLAAGAVVAAVATKDLR
jgi:uncharacterized membrane protein